MRNFTLVVGKLDRPCQMFIELSKLKTR